MSKSTDFFQNISEISDLKTWTSRKIQVICVNVIKETHDVKTFQFKAIPENLFHFKPGQFIGFQLILNGKQYNRSYTIASSPTRPHLLELTIKIDPTGVVSQWFHNNIKENDELEFRGPAGRFNCMDIESDKIALISAGSGITPMMSMTRFWTDQATKKDIRFLNWSRSVKDIIFRRELALLDHNYDNLNVDIVCTQPGLSENWLGKRGRINQVLLEDLVPDMKERTVFCCGPNDFMKSVKKTLKDIGFDFKKYHEETFDPGGKKKAKILAEKDTDKKIEKPVVQIYQLTFAKTEKTVEIKSTENLLEKIEAEGVSLSSACRVGNCGACKVKKISGFTYTENTLGLLDDEKEDGYILTCTTQVKSDVVLDI